MTVVCLVFQQNESTKSNGLFGRGVCRGDSVFENGRLRAQLSGVEVRKWGRGLAKIPITAGVR